MTYDGTGAAVLTIVAVGTGDAASTQTAYDGAGRVQAVKDPLGTITRTLYDPAGGQLATTVVNCTGHLGTRRPRPTGWNCTAAPSTDGTWNLDHDVRLRCRREPGRASSPPTAAGRARATTPRDASRRGPTTTWRRPGRHRRSRDDLVAYDDAGRRPPSAPRPRTGRRSPSPATCTTPRPPDDRDPQLHQHRHDAARGPRPPAPGPGRQDRGHRTSSTTYGYDARGNRIPGHRARPLGRHRHRRDRHHPLRLRRRRPALPGGGKLHPDRRSSGTPSPTAAAPRSAARTTTNVSTRYTYDGAGNLATMIDANGNTTTYGYDASGRQTSVTDALGRTRDDRVRRPRAPDEPDRPGRHPRHLDVRRRLPGRHPHRGRRHHDVHVRRQREPPHRRGRRASRSRRSTTASPVPPT